MDLLNSILTLLGDFISSFWWVFIPVFLLFIFLDLRKFYKDQKERRGMEWELLELVPPKEVEKSPKAMEQVFATVDEISSGWASFELVGRAGSTHFFIRVPKGYRNLVESAVYAQYPDSEIRNIPEEDDYVAQFPPNLPNETYDIWGTELILGKEDGYPIRTYPDFQESGKSEEVVDPIAGITEIMSKLEGSEGVWLQILIKPADDDKWNAEAEDLIDEIMGNKKESPGPLTWLSPWFNALAEFFGNLFKALFEHPTWVDQEESDSRDSGGKNLTPGKHKVVQAIEEKMSKVGFHAAIRFVYIDRRDRFTQSNISGVMGALRQFNTNNLNAFKENGKVKTKTSGLFKDKKLESRKKRIFSKYTVRDFPKKNSILNAEELATVYHFPATGVKSPLLRRVSSKRGGPPPDLPIQT